MDAEIFATNNYVIEILGGRKVSHYQIIKISYYIVLKPAIEIWFIHKIEVSTKHCNIIRWH